MNLFDGFVNFVSGLGNPLADKGANNTYQHHFDNPDANDAIYRTSGFAKRSVDIHASDATRKWRAWQGDDAGDLLKAEKKLKLKLTVRDAIAAGKRLGGAAIYMGFKGISAEELAEPLDPETVKPGSLEYVTLFDRTELSPVTYDEDPTSPRYKRGEIFSIDRGEGANLRIHWTRFAWFGGAPTPRRIVEIQNGWDDSVYCAWRPYIEAVDSSLANMNALLHETRTQTLKIPGLSQYFETDDSERRLTKRILAMARMKSTVHMTAIDSMEEVTTENASFTGVVEVFGKSLEAMAGVCGTPVIRFLGTSPKGLNGTGQSELTNHYDAVASYQENELSAALWTLDAVLWRSVTGKSVDDMAYDWRPLLQASEKEQAETAKTNAETIKIYNDLGLFDDELFAAVVLGHLKQTHLFPTLQEVLDDLSTDDEFIEIDEPEVEAGGIPGNPGPAQIPNGGAPRPAAGSKKTG